MKVINPVAITASMVTSSTAAEPSGTDPAAWSAGKAYAVDDYAYLAATHMIYRCLIAHAGAPTSSATVTMTVAAPCVVTWNSHGLIANAEVVFTTTGALPSGLVAGQKYYVKNPATNTFNLADSFNGAALTTTGTQSGTHTATTTSTSPDVDIARTTPKWMEWYATNKYKMFDEAISSVTSATSPLTVTVVPGTGIDSIALMELSGTSLAVTVKDAPGGTTVYTSTTNLDGTIILDWYEYFFEPFANLTQVVLTGIPNYYTCEVTISITSASTVACGACVMGMMYDLGDTSYGAQLGLINYTSKRVDSYGRTVLNSSTYSKRFQASMLIDYATFNRVESLLERELRDVAAVWIGTDSTDYAATVCYGYYKDWSMTISYPTSTLATLQIESLT